MQLKRLETWALHWTGVHSSNETPARDPKLCVCERIIHDNVEDDDDDDDEEDDNVADNEVEDDDVEEDEDEDQNVEDEVEDDDVEVDDVKGEEDDDVENDDVKEEDDDVEDDDVEEDRSKDRDPHFVRACAVEMHLDISEEPFYARIYRKDAAPQKLAARFVRACALLIGFNPYSCWLTWSGKGMTWLLIKSLEYLQNGCVDLQNLVIFSIGTWFETIDGWPKKTDVGTCPDPGLVPRGVLV